MTEKEFEKATEGITYKIVESMESTEIVNHTEGYHLYKYSHDDCCDDDGAIVVLKENDTDEEIAVVLLDKNEQLLFDMLID